MTSHIPLSDLRKNYELGTLEEDQVASEPLRQFQTWLEEAFKHKIPEPNAMTLATVDPNGRPSSRIVLIKDCDSRGIVWFTNYQSRKGQALAAQPFAALQFHWVEMERVVRIEGAVEKVSAEESDAYFASRPLTHRIGAWASEQSQPIPGRGTIVAKGTLALATSAISSATCTSAQTLTATGVVTTDVVLASFNGDPTAVTGYVPLTAGMLTIIVYPTANTLNVKVCNNTSSSITPGAITLNLSAVR